MILDIVKAWVPRNRVARGVALLSGGTALGQLISILATPFITRLYVPQDFGLLAIYASIISILLVGSAFRYELAIPLPKDSKSAVNIVVLSIFIVIGLTCLLGVTLVFFGESLLRLVNGEQIIPYMWTLPLALICAGSYQVFNYWAVREKDYSSIAETKVLQSIGQVVTKITLGLIYIGPIGLFLGNIAGQTVGLSKLYQGFLHKRESVFPIHIKELWEISIRYRKFPMFMMAASIMNAIGTYIPPILIAGLYGPSIAGLYFLAQTILGAPLALIGRSVGQVYHGEVAELVRYERSKLADVFTSTAKKLLITGSIIVGLILIIAPWGFGLIFGEKWAESGTYTSILCIMFLARFVVSPLSVTLVILEHQHLSLVIQLLILITSITSFTFAAYIGMSPINAIALFSTMMAISYLIIFFIYYSCVRRSS